MPIDASALVELVIAGRHRHGADALLTRYTKAEPRLIFASAAHVLVEAASALRRLVRIRVLDPGSALEAVKWLSQIDLVLDPTGPRLTRIWSLRDSMSACDAAYAAVAEAIGRPLVTADARLLRACRQTSIAAVQLDEAAAP